MVTGSNRGPPPGGNPNEVFFSFTEFISGYMFESFLYGIVLVLFSAAVCTLVNRLRGFSRWSLLGYATLMFAISTTNVVMSLCMLFKFLLHGKRFPYYMIKLRHIFLLVNNLFADILLIYRCYAVWSRSLHIIVFPCLLFVASGVMGVLYVSGPMQGIRRRENIYMWLALSFNILVTTLIAARIWWMAHKTRKILGPILARRYYSALVIIIESGAIYSIYVLIDLVLKNTVCESLLLMDAGLSQLVVIAPTLIIVQVGLGRQARDVEATVETSRENGTSGVILTTVHSH